MGKKNYCGVQYCSAINCSNSRRKIPSLSFFRFPKDTERCKEWVKNCRRADLYKKQASCLYASYQLCSLHFEDSQFMNAELKNKLVHNAVPTQFCVPNPPKSIASKRPPPKRRSEEKTKKPKVRDLRRKVAVPQRPSVEILKPRLEAEVECSVCQDQVSHQLCCKKAQTCKTTGVVLKSVPPVTNNQSSAFFINMLPPNVLFLHNSGGTNRVNEEITSVYPVVISAVNTGVPELVMPFNLKPPVESLLRPKIVKLSEVLLEPQSEVIIPENISGANYDQICIKKEPEDDGGAQLETRLLDLVRPSKPTVDVYFDSEEVNVKDIKSEPISDDDEVKQEARLSDFVRPSKSTVEMHLESNELLVNTIKTEPISDTEDSLQEFGTREPTVEMYFECEEQTLNNPMVEPSTEFSHKKPDLVK